MAPENPTQTPAQQEREACARIADDYALLPGDTGTEASLIAASIRGLPELPPHRQSVTLERIRCCKVAMAYDSLIDWGDPWALPNGDAVLTKVNAAMAIAEAIVNRGKPPEYFPNHKRREP
jgi:hypothetical protein